MIKNHFCCRTDGDDPGCACGHPGLCWGTPGAKAKSSGAGSAVSSCFIHPVGEIVTACWTWRTCSARMAAFEGTSHAPGAPRPGPPSSPGARDRDRARRVWRRPASASPRCGGGLDRFSAEGEAHQLVHCIEAIGAGGSVGQSPGRFLGQPAVEQAQRLGSDRRDRPAPSKLAPVRVVPVRWKPFQFSTERLALASSVPSQLVSLITIGSVPL